MTLENRVIGSSVHRVIGNPTKMLADSQRLLRVEERFVKSLDVPKMLCPLNQNATQAEC